MKCPKCVEEGKRSRVEVVSARSTLLHAPMAYDEDGVLQHHDPNTHTTTYRCSEGHSWVETMKPGSEK